MKKDTKNGKRSFLANERNDIMIIVEVWGKVNHRIWADEALFDIDEVPDDDCERIALSYHVLRQSWPHVTHCAIYDDSIMECIATDTENTRTYSKEETEKIINSDFVKKMKKNKKRRDKRRDSKTKKD